MRAMRLASVNVGQAHEIEHGERVFRTGIRKLPVSGPVSVSSDSVGDDAICDTEHHGGPDQVVYAYSSDDYAWWGVELGATLAPGTFGENLTIDGLPDDLAVGDRLLIGEVVLEATAPRIPCSTLAARMQDSGFGLKFRKARRPGIYFRVLNPGELAAGDAVTLVENAQPKTSILELFDLAYEPNPRAEDVERMLEAPVATRTRVFLEAKLPSAK